MGKLCKTDFPLVKLKIPLMVLSRLSSSQKSHRCHQGVEDTDSEGCSASEGLSEIELRVRVIIIVVRVNELDIAVVDQLSDHGYAGPEASSPALEDNSLAERAGAVTGCGV